MKPIFNAKAQRRQAATKIKFDKEARRPGNQESLKNFRGFLASLLNYFWWRLGRAMPRR
jgi:hypothetical protein